jgi:glycosyltransferase involved in cell wall biosynthesis
LSYSGADLLLFPGDTATFAMTVLEAQACGLPAMVADVGGPRDLVRHGRTGWVLPAASRADWADGIRRASTTVRRHPALHAAMRREARRRVVEDRDWTTVLRA